MALNPQSSVRQGVRLVWHRRDLRLHDNWMYSHCDAPDIATISLYIFDPADFAPRPSTCRPKEWNAVNVGPHACRFLLESVHDLRNTLRSTPSLAPPEASNDLIVRCGDPLVVIPQLLEAIPSITEINWNEEPGMYEAKLSRDLHSLLQTRYACDDGRGSLQQQQQQLRIRTSMEYTLYHPNDLPNRGQEWEQLAQPNKKRKKKRQLQPPREPLPQHVIDVSQSRWAGRCRIMGDFRRAARTKTSPRPCMPAPSHLRPPSITVDPGAIPTFDSLTRPLMETGKPILGMSEPVVLETIESARKLWWLDSTASVGDDNDDDDGMVLHGGETNALKHLQHFVAHHASSAKRNLASVENHQSSHLSSYLAFGCISPRRIVEEAEKHQEKQNAGDCNWLISHMTMRDFFLYTCLATGKQFYALDGIPINKKRAADLVQWKAWGRDDGSASVEEHWQRWMMGTTGLPLVDAAMRELRCTGYCSNRVRQNVASLLTKDLGIDWRAGAELFQFLLADHCVGANWGNWLYFSGVGPDPKHRHFRTISQALKYDEDGQYVRKWVQELSHLRSREAHLRPWDYDDTPADGTDERETAMAAPWRTPIVDPNTQYVWQDVERLKEHGQLFPL